MRYLTAHGFGEKLAALPRASNAQPMIADTVRRLAAASKEDLLNPSAAPWIHVLPDGVYVARAGAFRVFFAFGTDNDGEYLILLDIAEAGARHSGTRTV